MPAAPTAAARTLLVELLRMGMAFFLARRVRGDPRLSEPTFPRIGDRRSGRGCRWCSLTLERAAAGRTPYESRSGKLFTR
ncbi:hypothetical protein Acsp05_00460 [Actinokineospora sp. NBRC 105648]|nr:hypothetical protein Acsp05_00460 [Actinokineospora sp. NBRC 105648]